MMRIRRFIRLHRQMTTYGILLGISVFGFLFLLVPVFKKTVTLLSDVRSLSKEVAIIQGKADMLENTDLGYLQSQSDSVLAAVPEDKSVSTMLSTVDALALKHRLTISDIGIEGISSLSTRSAKLAVKPEGNILTQTLTVQGELMGLRNFLAECVKVRRLLRVQNMSITSIPKSSQISAKLVLDFFYLALPQSIGKPSDPMEPFSEKETATLTKLAGYPILFSSGSEPSSSSIGTEPAAGQGMTLPAVLDPFLAPRRVTTLSPSPAPTSTPAIPVRSDLSPSASPKPTSTPAPATPQP